MNHHHGEQHDADEQEHEGTEKPGGLGDDHTIQPDPDGLGATTTGEDSTFEPEEDEAAEPDVR